MTLLAEYVDNEHNDLTTVNAARVSFDKQHDYDVAVEGLISDDVRLVKYLASHGHWTPFSHARFTFQHKLPILYDIPPLEEDRAGLAITADLAKVRHSLYGWVQLLKNGHVLPQFVASITNQLLELMPVSMQAFGFEKLPKSDDCETAKLIRQCDEFQPEFIDVTVRETIPIFVARQRFKHMVGNTYNEVSRRYVDDTPVYYFPDVWRGKPVDGAKQGSHGELPEHLQISCNLDLEDHHERCTQLYEDLLARGVAPEQARMVLPQSMITSYWVTASMTAWVRAYKQRSDSHAQKEIRDLAKQWNDIMLPVLGRAWEGMTL